MSRTTFPFLENVSDEGKKEGEIDSVRYDEGRRKEEYTMETTKEKWKGGLHPITAGVLDKVDKGIITQGNIYMVGEENPGST